MLLRLFHHVLDVVRGVGQLPPGIHIVGAGDDVHGLGLQRGDVLVEFPHDLARRKPKDTDIEPIVCRKCRLLPVVALRPLVGNGITDEKHGWVNPKRRATPGSA